MPAFYLALKNPENPQEEPQILRQFCKKEFHTERTLARVGLDKFDADEVAKRLYAGLYELNEMSRTYERVPYENLTLVKTDYDDWRLIMYARCASKVFSPLPWDDDLDPIEDHFAHIAYSDGTKVAFIENEAKGKRDIITVMRAGRYLNKYYPDMSENDRKRYAAMMEDAQELRFAKTRDAIKMVYWFGPRSCMGGFNGDPKYKGVEAFDTDGIHPCEAYASGDFAIAYLANKDVETDSALSDLDCYRDEDDISAILKIRARAVVDMKNKEYVRIYCDGTGTLKRLLHEQGFRAVYAFKPDLRLLRIENNSGQVIAPYIDGDLQSCSDMGDCLKLSDDGEVQCVLTNGLAETYEDKNFCEYYEEYVSEDLVHIADVGQDWCQSAASDHAFFCEGTHQYYSDYGTIAYYVGYSTYCEDYCLHNFQYCEGYEEFFDDSPMHFSEFNRDTQTIETDDSLTYSPRYMERYGYQSAALGDDVFFRSADELRLAESILCAPVYHYDSEVGLIETHHRVNRETGICSTLNFDVVYCPILEKYFDKLSWDRLTDTENNESAMIAAE